MEGLLCVAVKSQVVDGDGLVPAAKGVGGSRSLYTVGEAAERLGTSRGALSKLGERGGVRSFRTWLPGTRLCLSVIGAVDVLGWWREQRGTRG